MTSPVPMCKQHRLTCIILRYMALPGRYADTMAGHDRWSGLGFCGDTFVGTWSSKLVQNFARFGRLVLALWRVFRSPFGPLRQNAFIIIHCTMSAFGLSRHEKVQVQVVHVAALLADNFQEHTSPVAVAIFLLYIAFSLLLACRNSFLSSDVEVSSGEYKMKFSLALGNQGWRFSTWSLAPLGKHEVW